MAITTYSDQFGVATDWLWYSACRGVGSEAFLSVYFGHPLAEKVEGKAQLFSKSRRGAGSEAFSSVYFGHPLAEMAKGKASLFSKSC